MSFGNAVIGASQGMALVDQRNERLKKLQMQQETHEQQKTLTDQKIEQQDLVLKQLKQELSKKQMFEAMSVAVKQKDPTLLKNWLLKDPEAQELFENPVDFKVASQVDDLDGTEDEILLDNGFDPQTIEQMSQEDKLKAIKQFGDDTFVITKADGSKETMTLDELAAGTGYLNQVGKQDREEYAKAIAAGGLKRAYALAIFKGDEELAKKYKEALKQSEPTSGEKPTAAYKNAKTIVLAQQPELANNPKALDKAIGTYMAEDAQTAKRKNLDMALSALEKGQQVYESVTQVKDPEAAHRILSTKTAREAYTLENELIKNDKNVQTAIPDVEKNLQAIQSFTPIIESIASGKVKDLNAITKAINTIKDKLPHENARFWNIDGMDAAKFEEDARQYVNQLNLSANATLATLSLLKAMSGLAVTEQEREIYDKLLGQTPTDDIHKMFVAAQTFVKSRGLATSGFIDRLATNYPVHAATYKVQLDKVLSTAKPENYTKVDPEVEIQKQKMLASEIAKALKEAF
jgi:hypothetical protein